MKAMSCDELGGACNRVFTAETFDEISEMSRQHGIKMMQQGNKAHLKAMTVMQTMMKDPSKMMQWMEAKRKVFEEKPTL